VKLSAQENPPGLELGMPHLCGEKCLLQHERVTWVKSCCKVLLPKVQTCIMDIMHEASYNY
jgi:hypothetical protein